ncbi:hypothetical protein Bpfe_016579, partial [Biomphalaria pfeifferi]
MTGSMPMELHGGGQNWDRNLKFCFYDQTLLRSTGSGSFDALQKIIRESVIHG